METTRARYDDIADWYAEETATWGTPQVMSPLPEDISGQRVLELACGHGRVTPDLVRAGADVTAVDLSAKLLGLAQANTTPELSRVRFIQGDVARLDWWDGSLFDGVMCDMALMDIDDLEGTIATAAAVLKPGGWFAFSVFHPCYPGGPGSVSGLSSWPPDRGYSAEGWWTTEGEGIRGRVGASHRMMSTYLNAVLRAGLQFEGFWEKEFEVPLFFAARCRKP